MNSDEIDITNSACGPVGWGNRLISGRALVQSQPGRLLVAILGSVTLTS